jgi:REP-associated tyrosine transposase
MTRPPRLQAPGAIYHVVTRGIRKAEIFTDVRDRVRFLQLLGHNVELLRWRCHSYCLMTNHYHLLVETPNANISVGMHRLNGVYAKWFNWRHGYEGHLFERRFRGIIVEGDAQFLEAARYIVLNPVRAGFRPGPRGWRWSSYQELIGVRERSAFLTASYLLSLFSPDVNRAADLYADFVAAGLHAHRLLGHVPMPGTSTRLA